MAAEFLLLLTLTPKGRADAAGAAANLDEAGKALVEHGGAVDKLVMTYGQYDAAIAGSCPDTDVLTSFVAWINDQGYFTTSTMMGVAPTKFVPMQHK